jgi:hypothetical protein
MNYIGVSTKNGKHRARVCVHYQFICLGSYDSAEQAARARDRYVTDNKLNRKLNFLEGL